jgi:hypothetical protein
VVTPGDLLLGHGEVVTERDTPGDGGLFGGLGGLRCILDDASTAVGVRSAASSALSTARLVSSVGRSNSRDAGCSSACSGSKSWCVTAAETRGGSSER